MSSSGLLSTTSVVVGVTGTPGLTGRSSTRPLMSAVTLRTYSGSSVPGALTSRFISPRFTVSNQRVPRSTGGAAGWRRLIVYETGTRLVTPTARMMYRLVFLGGPRLISKVTSRAERAGGGEPMAWVCAVLFRKVHADSDRQLTHVFPTTSSARTESIPACDARLWECTSHNR